jgi:hypothetical protein
MASGLFVSDCSSTDWAWLDLGCAVQNIGTDLGQGITNLLEPVWIILAVVAVLIIVILFAPNTKHIIPHLTFL